MRFEYIRCVKHGPTRAKRCGASGTSGMARRRAPLVVDAEKGRQDREFLEAMASDEAGDDRTRRRALLILALLGGADLETAAEQAQLSVATAKAKLRQFNEGGWKALLTVQ